MKQTSKMCTFGIYNHDVQTGTVKISDLHDFKGHPFKVERDMELTNLIPKILDMVDEGKIAFTIAVELSYLTETEQYELHAVMDLEQSTPSLSQANRMKRMSQSAGLDMDSIYAILEEEKPNQREQIKIRADVLADYFPPDYTPKQKVEIIEKLVKEWHDRQL